MRLQVIILVIFLILNVNYLHSLKLKKGSSEYSESAYSEVSNSGTEDSGSAYVSTRRSPTSSGKSAHMSEVDKSENTSQVESDDEDIEPSEATSGRVHAVNSHEVNSDHDDDIDNESSEVQSVKHRSETTENGHKEVNMPHTQYMARQQRFDLASTVYPASDVTSTNYVFLSPAAQRRIDKKISRLQKGGGRHGSMRETKAIGEWQRRYYSRPATEYNEIRASSQEGNSMFTWVILGFIFILVIAICACGMNLVSKG
ncbi:putative signal peptide-containing protein [Cryptosporidium canis]|uniref:Signal peptide-containing protein n=1 Tax=Cryptosporidium canis TaxID=195482 RepID=A0ABQ8P9G4_9CRYT|nr:putative signal peptide-containing protein [Cryptosporidium canis]KAJ1613327.1 putative signal peptide-containing protein [Cryptosporidium canis]